MKWTWLVLCDTIMWTARASVAFSVLFTLIVFADRCSNTCSFWCQRYICVRRGYKGYATVYELFLYFQGRFMYLIGTHSMCPTTLKQRYIIRYSVYPMYIEWSTMEKVNIQLGSRPIVEILLMQQVSLILQIAFTWFNTDLPVTFNTWPWNSQLLLCRSRPAAKLAATASPFSLGFDSQDDQTLTRPGTAT